MCQHEYNMLLHYISLDMHYQLSYVEHVPRLKRINPVYYPTFCCYCFINSILYISISISIHAYTYIYLYIYTRICIKKCVVYSSLILPNKSMHQRFIDLDDNHYQLSYLKYILNLLINKFDQISILLLLSTFVISRHSFTVSKTASFSTGCNKEGFHIDG